MKPNELISLIQQKIKSISFIQSVYRDKNSLCINYKMRHDFD